MTMGLTAEVTSRNQFGSRETFTPLYSVALHPGRTAYDNGRFFLFVWLGYSAFAGVASIPEPLVWRLRST